MLNNIVGYNNWNGMFFFAARVAAEGCGPREEAAFGHGGSAQGFQFRGGPMPRQIVGFAKGLHQVSFDLV